MIKNATRYMELRGMDWKLMEKYELLTPEYSLLIKTSILSDISNNEGDEYLYLFTRKNCTSPRFRFC